MNNPEEYEIKTLVSEIGVGDDGDAELAALLTQHWQILDITVLKAPSVVGGISEAIIRVVTLKIQPVDIPF